MSTGAPRQQPPELAPLAVPMTRIVVAGILGWVLALVVLLVVPDGHAGARWWWPWCAVAGIGLGCLGLAYVGRGRGNAADA